MATVAKQNEFTLVGDYEQKLFQKGAVVMKTGNLYFDNNPDRSLAEKVRGAAKQYKAVRGVDPNLCYVHPFSLPVEIVVDGIEVRATNSVLVNHLFIGVEDES